MVEEKDDLAGVSVCGVIMMDRYGNVFGFEHCQRTRQPTAQDVSCRLNSRQHGKFHDKLLHKIGPIEISNVGP
jgi:hypothetical protein